MTYSHSRISTFKTCPLKFKFTYIDKIKRDTDSVEAFMGNKVHEVLEKLYTDIKYKKQNSLEDLLAMYEKNWETGWHSDIVIVKKEYSADNYKEIGRDCIAKFYERYHPFDGSTILGTEMRISLDLFGNGGTDYTGFIDRLDQRKDGVYEIHDYKTSGTLPSQGSVDSDRQLASYHLAIKNMFSDADKVELKWHYLVFDKELVSTRTDFDLEQLKEQIILDIKAIETERDFLPKESALCGWCEYQDLCPKRKHYVLVNKLDEGQFMGETGVALVNKYMLLEAKKKEVKEFMDRVDREIGMVKNALVKYADENGIDIVKGKDKKARVRTETKYSFPLKSDPRRPALDRLIKESGKWEEVSDVNPWTLAKAVSQGKWDSELLEKIKSHGEKMTSVSVYLSNLSAREKVEN